MADDETAVADADSATTVGETDPSEVGLGVRASLEYRGILSSTNPCVARWIIPYAGASS